MQYLYRIYIYKGEAESSNGSEWPISQDILSLNSTGKRVKHYGLVMNFIRHCWKLLPKYVLSAAFKNTVVDQVKLYSCSLPINNE